MTLADRTFPGAVRTRLPLVVLLCAVALGIVGMHGLASGPDSGGHIGHHAAVVAALDVAGLPPPFERQLTVLRI